MTKPPHPPRRRHLSHEDEALWAHTAASLKPIRAKKARHHPRAAELDAAEPFAPKARAAKASASAAPVPAKAPARPTAAPPATPPLAAFDRKAARRLRQGQLEIEARIDLHGLRQHEAHSALRRFLHASFAKGLRWVLVITGKGGPARPRDDDGLGLSERGVLRKNVPMWLAEPELRAIVVSFTSAALAHGGEGALYVQLRNAARPR